VRCTFFSAKATEHTKLNARAAILMPQYVVWSFGVVVFVIVGHLWRRHTRNSTPYPQHHNGPCAIILVLSFTASSLSSQDFQSTIRSQSVAPSPSSHAGPPTLSFTLAMEKKKQTSLLHHHHHHHLRFLVWR
jgi:hypothetical protein